MLTIESILCPVDLSHDSADALRYALTLARAYDAKLYLCHVVAPQPARRDLDELTEQVRARFAEMLVEHLGYGDLARVNWEGLVVACGDAAEAIVREAASLACGLVVMRSRRRPRAAALLGSTAEAVCRSAPCPVLVTHGREREWVSGLTGEIDLRRVVVAYDFSTDSELALLYGISLAQEYEAELHLLHVIPKPQDEPELGWTDSNAEGAYHRAARRLQNAVPSEAHLWCRVTHSVRWGKPYREVLAYAEEQSADLVCMGAQGAGFGLGALFGSNVDRVLRQSPCPVFVARPLRPAAEPARAKSSAEGAGLAGTRRSC